MNKYQKLYDELRKTLSDKEIAESMMIPADLSKKEELAAKEDLKAFRFKLLSEMTEDQRLYADLLRFRYQMEDYLEQRDYNQKQSFGNYLEEYTRILKRTKKKLSEELSIHNSRLSRILNDKEEPNIEFIYRLEKHSGGLVPAINWWKLVAKKQEFKIKEDTATRKQEASKVKSVVKFRA